MANRQPEMLLNKLEVDSIFSFNKTQWSQAAAQWTAPGWTLQVYEHDSGTQITGFEPSTGIGLCIQPFFRDETRPPDAVIVGGYFPLGMMSPMADKSRREMESVAQSQIGAAYSLRLKHEIKNKREMFEFLITEL